MKRTKTRKALVIMIFLLPLFSMGQQEGKISKVKIYAPADAYNRANVTGLLDIDHFYTDDDGGIVSEIDETMLARLKNMPYKYEILVPDVMRELDSLNQIYYASTPQQRVAIEQQGSTSGAIIVTPAAFQVKATFGGYYSFAEMEAAMDALVATYPTIASKTSIGTTVGGRDIWVIKISDNVASDEVNEPEILYMGLQHAREAIGGSSMIFFMQYLCDRYAADSRIKDLVDNREFFIIPCFNPDGWEYNRTNWADVPGGNWRKNRRNNGGSFGVDLNRNWGVDWANCSAPISGPTSSCGVNTPSSDTYWGTAAFSEAETQAVRTFAKQHHLVAGFDQHAYGPYYSLPFGRKALHTMGTKGINFYTAVPALMGMYNGMRAADSYDALGYEVAGGFKDWMLMGELGSSIGSGLKDTVWAMTGEGSAAGGLVNSTTTANGTRNFWAPASQIINLSKSMCYQNLQLAYAAGSYVDIQDAGDIVLAAKAGTLSFTIKRLGLSSAPVTVTLQPLENVIAVGAPVTIPAMAYYDTYNGNISYTLNPSLVNGQRARFVWTVSTGGYTYSDTVTKFLNPTVLLNDDMQGSYATNWTGTWVFTSAGGYNSTQALSETPSGTNYTASQNKICQYKTSFNLSGATAAYLTFMTRHRIENFNDKCQVQVSTDNATWTAIAGSTTVAEPGTLDGSTLNGQPAFTGVRDYYTNETFSLNAYLGQATLYLRFVFTSDNDASSFKFEVDDGIYIDNLKVIKSSTPMITLPVNFLNVTGTLQPDHSIRVNWDAIVDQEHDYFEVQHSTDGNAFTSLGMGPQLAPYQFVHLNPVKGNNYYRIKQVDKSGQFTYSKIVNVIVAKPVTVSLYPNPVKDLLNIKIVNRRSDLLNIEIADIQGRVVYKKNTIVDQNTVELVVDMKLLKPQVYILKVTNSNGETITTEKVIKN